MQTTHQLLETFRFWKLWKWTIEQGLEKETRLKSGSTNARKGRAVLSDELRQQLGITPQMLRLSVGVEHIDDLLADLDQALAAATA